MSIDEQHTSRIDLSREWLGSGFFFVVFYLCMNIFSARFLALHQEVQEMVP